MITAATYRYDSGSDDYGARILDAASMPAYAAAAEGPVREFSVSGSDDMEWEVSRSKDSSRRKYAKPDEWAKHRQRITDLYRQNPLPVVVEIMSREHNFWASEKMYKDRFKEWRLNTKNKKPLFRAKRKKHTPNPIPSKQIIIASHNTQGGTVTPNVNGNYVFLNQASLPEPYAVLQLPDFDHSEVIIIAVKNWIKSSIEICRSYTHIPSDLYTCDCCANQVHKRMFSDYGGQTTSTRWIGHWSDKRYTQLILNEVGGIYNVPVLVASLAWLLSLLLRYQQSFNGRSQRSYKLHQLINRTQFNLQSAHPLVLIVTGLGAPDSLPVPLAARTIEYVENMINDLTQPHLRPYTEISMKLDQIILILKYFYGGLSSDDFLSGWKATVDRGLESLPMFHKVALDIRLIYLRLLGCFESSLFVQEARKCLAVTTGARFRVCAEYRALYFVEIASAYYRHHGVLYATEYMKEAISMLDWMEDTWLEQKREEVQSLLNSWSISSTTRG